MRAFSTLIILVTLAGFSTALREDGYQEPENEFRGLNVADDDGVEPVADGSISDRDLLPAPEDDSYGLPCRSRNGWGVGEWLFVLVFSSGECCRRKGRYFHHPRLTHARRCRLLSHTRGA